MAGRDRYRHRLNRTTGPEAHRFGASSCPPDRQKAARKCEKKATKSDGKIQRIKIQQKQLLSQQLLSHSQKPDTSRLLSRPNYPAGWRITPQAGIFQYAVKPRLSAQIRPRVCHAKRARRKWRWPYFWLGQAAQATTAGCQAQAGEERARPRSCHTPVKRGCQHDGKRSGQVTKR